MRTISSVMSVLYDSFSTELNNYDEKRLEEAQKIQEKKEDDAE